jgi:hypothetical protein
MRKRGTIAGSAAIFVVLLMPVSSARAEPPPEPFDGLTTPLPEGGRAAPPPTLGARGRVGLLPHPRDAAASLGLVRRGDGGFDYVDPGHRFRARIMTDGTVQFADRWRKPSSKDRQNGRPGGRPPEAVIAAINPFVGVKLGGPLEWFMRATHQDPAGHAKAEFLATTRDFRTRLAVGDTRMRVHERLRALPAELLAIWTDLRRPLAERKRLVFQHWDDCADVVAKGRALTDAAADEIASLRADAAADARQTIESFVRRHAPRGTARAYAARELDSLNARRRTAVRFDPYAESRP